MGALTAKFFTQVEAAGFYASNATPPPAPRRARRRNDDRETSQRRAVLAPLLEWATNP
jgi:hypothetical protein